ncbi:WD40/YVTN/BNR-like repeat-containing protein [Thiocystis violacea]|uniref:WD40/YVTN/BNR-like repeat-containing protein n=1 Tax=Thiocystis violacea TaxID=13725 RepID=UPI001907238F|nr:hypothetical protein [Thiocystis violacea]MBK1723560.1 hypothetical protein [Thiocystis violacea]
MHDLYQSTYLADDRIDGARGHLMVSTDQGASWTVLHDFGHPVVWLAFDPQDRNRLYASVVHSQAGGIYVTHDLQNGTAATWQALSAPPRTQGHAFTIHALADGTLVATYSGHMDSNWDFTARSGVFVSSDGGATWVDRSHSDMQWWTKDLVVDPHDSSQHTWLVSVFRHWGGGHEHVGGLYRTTDRGLSWTRISDLPRVESVTIDPSNPDIAWMTTETQGLWKSENFSHSAPVLTQDPEYPFRHPLRVFINPFDPAQVWVTNFGDGLRAMGVSGDPSADCSGSDVQVSSGTIFPSGQTVCIATHTLATANPVSIPVGASVFFRAARIRLTQGFGALPGARFSAVGGE